MKLATVRHRGGTAVVVESAGSAGSDGSDGGSAVVLPGYPDVDAVLAVPAARLCAEVDAALATGERLDVAGLEWLPVVVRPGKVVCVALNNSANPDRIMSGPSTPAMFVKPASSLTGHLQPILVRDDYGRVHPEPELAVVVGRDATDVTPEQALGHVFGYSIINDITSPTMRAEDTFHYRAVHPSDTEPDGVRHVDTWVSYPARYKGSDTFGPLGPWVVTADDVPDPHALRIRCRHDGRLVTDDSTANLRFSVAEVVAFASRYLTLQRGDVIAMGTALQRAATGGAVQNIDLTALGGTVEVEIEGIGTLRNPVARR